MPVLLVTTHRPGYQLRWADMPFFAQIPLDRLADDEMGQMASGLLGQDVAEDLLRFIAEKADGNPLFIEEVTRALVERNFVIHQPARLQLASTAEVEFPSTVQGIIQARIDALGEPVKQTVQIAAVIGREFDLPLVTATSDAATEVPGHIDTLKRVELVQQTRLLPNLEYRFKHAVIQGVAYRSLLGPRRQALHGAIGRSMEHLGREAQAGILAHHYSLSDQQEKAVRYALLAGDQANRLYANAEAASHYDLALDLAKSLPPSAELQRAQIDAALKRAGVGTTREALEADERNLDEALLLADTLGDEPRMASVLYWLGRLAYVRGMFGRATDYAEQSLAIADRLDDESLAAPPVNLMGRRYYLTGEYARAGRLLARSVEQMRNLGNPTEEATAAGFAGVTFGALGEFERALAYADHGLDLSRQLKNPFVEAAAYNYRAVAHCHRGSAAAAIVDCEEARRIAERVGDRFRIYLVQFYEGHAYAMSGNPQKAREAARGQHCARRRARHDDVARLGPGPLGDDPLGAGRRGQRPIALSPGDRAGRGQPRPAGRCAGPSDIGRSLGGAAAGRHCRGRNRGAGSHAASARNGLRARARPQSSGLRIAALRLGPRRGGGGATRPGGRDISPARHAGRSGPRRSSARRRAGGARRGELAVNGRIGIVLSGWAPAMTLMSGAMLGFSDAGVEFEVISTAGVGALIGLLSLAPKRGTPQRGSGRAAQPVRLGYSLCGLADQLQGVPQIRPVCRADARSAQPDPQDQARPESREPARTAVERLGRSRFLRDDAVDLRAQKRRADEPRSRNRRPWSISPR